MKDDDHGIGSQIPWLEQKYPENPESHNFNYPTILLYKVYMARFNFPEF